MSITDEGVADEGVADDAAADDGAADDGAAADDLGAERVGRYRRCSTEERRVALEGLAAVAASVHAELLDVAAAGVAEGDPGLEKLIPVDWLAHACGLRRSTAADWLRTARELASLPRLQAGFAAGSLSWDKIRAAARIAEPATDSFVADEAAETSADELAYLAQRARARTRADDASRARLARLTLRTDETNDGMYVRGWLPGDQATRLAQALEREAEQLGPDADGQWAPLPQRQAQVLFQWAENAQVLDRDVDRTRLNVHVDARILTGLEPGNAELDRSVLASLDTVRRLACAAEVIWQIHGEDTVVGIGRMSREVPTWLRRILHWRDQICRFPGCGRPIRHFHHIIHWIMGGHTDSQTLIGLCWSHHHLVHEGGWHIEGNADQQVVFVGPDGQRRTSVPPPMAPQTRRRAKRAAAAARRRARQRQRAASTSGSPPST
jgi:hypothetical protein